MLTPSHLPFLPAGRAIRRHRTAVQQLLAAEPAAHLLPALLTLPLSAAPLPDPAAILAAPRSLVLTGAAGAGRSLMLLQVLHRWAESGGQAPLIYVALAEADTPNLTPRAVLAAALHSADLPPALLEGDRPGILLIDDWELLPADRRAVWRAYLTSAGRGWRALRAVVALPAGEPWPELIGVALPAPDAARAATWLAHLLPDHDTAPLVAALAREPLTLVGASVAEVALLALTFPLSGLPASRAALYEQAYALVRPLVGETPRAGRAVLRHYRLARGFAGGDDLDALPSLGATERVAVAPLAAGLLDDPAPVYAALWEGEPDQHDERAMAAIVREHPGRAPRWELRLLERLAAAEADARSHGLLQALAPALPASLAAIGRDDAPRACELLRGLDAALAGERPWLALADDERAPAAVRWAAADLLVGRAAPEELAAPAPDNVALAVRSFLAAQSPEARPLLAQPPLREGFALLLGDTGAGERRAVAARAVAADATLPAELRAAALAAADDRELVERAALDDASGMRHAALAALGRQDPEAALAAIERSLGSPGADEGVRCEALEAAGQLELAGATGLLARAAINLEQSLAVRLHAVDLLAARGRGGAAVLRRLVAARNLSPVLRAAAAGHLGRLGVADALPELRNALELGPPPVRRAAATALGALGARDGMAEQCAAALVTGLRRVGVDTALGERIARALGHCGAALAVPTLAALLGPELDAALQSAWLRRIPALAERPAALWTELTLQEEARFALMEALADGGTMADPPSRLSELVARQAARIAMAAAAALGEIGAANPALNAAALSALRRALARPERADVVRAALAALGAAGDAAATLAAILDDNAAPATLRWLAVEALGSDAAARALLLRRLDAAADEPFLQAAVVRLLGEQRADEALAVLRRLAGTHEALPHLRRVAVEALGCIGGLEAAAALAAIAADQATPTPLRVAAADALPPHLDAATRATLHQLARGLRQQSELAAALARALARAGDHEALPALVRAAQSDRGPEAVASIAAIAALGDLGIAPLLVRISQSPTADPGVRLAAVAALLRLGGDEHEPLIREYLVSASPPLRMQAYADLAATRPDDLRLDAPLADPDAPLSLRLQALRQIAGRDADHPIVLRVLARADEEPQLRLAAAEALAGATTVAAVQALGALLALPQVGGRLAPPLLRRHCVDSLAALARGASAGAPAARAVLTALADDQRQPAEQRCWAAEALLRC